MRSREKRNLVSSKDEKKAAPREGAAVCYFSGIIVCKNASEVQELGRGCITLISD